MKPIIRAGSVLHNGFETPNNAKKFTIKSGQECTLRGLRNENNKWIATIFVFDTGIFKEVDYNIIEKYL